nr:MetaGeneMark_Unknown Function [uncultured bacterium]
MGRDVLGRRTDDSLQPEGTGAWPEIRLVRQADIRAEDNSELRDYLDELGQTAYGVGTAKSLGSLSIVYVNATDLGKMFERKSDQYNPTRRRALAARHALADDFNDFSRQEFGKDYRRQTVDHMTAHQLLDHAVGGFSFSNEVEVDQSVYTRPPVKGFKSVAETNRPVSDYIDAAVDPAAIPQTTYFGDATFDITGVRVFGKDGLGLDLSGNDQLYDEGSRVRDFLKDARLDTSILPQEFTPHVTIFLAEEHQTGRTIPLPPGLPDVAVFMPPKAIVN